MRLWKLRLNSIVMSRVVESESPESHVLERNCNSFFRFDEVEVASRSGLFRFGIVGKYGALLFFETLIYAKVFCILSLYRLYIYILLTCRKMSEALYIGQAITPTCFRRCQEIAVRLKFFIFCF